MRNATKKLPRAFLLGLDDSLRNELTDVLKPSLCELTDQADKADIVFCSWQDEAFKEASTRFKRTPVVVVSRLPEVNNWLDALEAGAADYCAAPFESVQMKWLLDTHLRQRSKSLTAA